MKKKGFTLIELLAVIIILAIIALIATPIVLDVINDSKKSVSKSAAAMVLDSAKLYYAEQYIKPDNAFAGYECTISNKSGCDELSIDGDKPDSAIITINKEGRVSGKVVFGDYTYYYCNNTLSETENSACPLNDYELIYEIDSNGIITGFKTQSSTAYNFIPKVYADELTVQAQNHLNSKEITIPEYIGEIEVKGIAANAFSSYDIDVITILPLRKLEIGENAFPTDLAKLKVKSCVTELYSTYEGIIESIAAECDTIVKPVCTFGTLSSVTIGQPSTIELTCTNEEYGIKDEDITTDKIVISETAEVSSINRETIENGYKYTLTINGISKGNATITIPEKTILSNNDIGNIEVISPEFEVKAPTYAAYSVGDDVTLRDGTTWVVVKDTDSSESEIKLMATSNVKANLTTETGTAMFTTVQSEYGLAYDSSENKSNVWANSTLKIYLDNTVKAKIGASLNTTISDITIWGAEELTALGCTVSGNDTNGYSKPVCDTTTEWYSNVFGNARTLTKLPRDGVSNGVWSAYINGVFESYYVYHTARGVRPVITISKSIISQ